ncbi:MAG: hypothetical protein Q9182_003036 [Xanthomendoza sp. 2 TL-2023]
MAKRISQVQREAIASRPLSAISYILNDALARLSTICHRISYSLPCLLALTPKVMALPAITQLPSQVSDSGSFADAQYLIDPFSWREWTDAAKSIRAGTNRLTCNKNLSIALSAAGSLAGATNSAASGALTLLPTAGALIGSPTKELWVVYKLMPIAGILSMLLSLGGNIVPSNARDYELNPATFSYGGMIATQQADEEAAEESEDRRAALHGPQAFAVKVKARSQDPRGGTRYVRVWYGILL